MKKKKKKKKAVKSLCLVVNYIRKKKKCFGFSPTFFNCYLFTDFSHFSHS